jgi:hypothetical protein
MKVPDLFVGKRLFVGDGKPEILGRGPTEIRGSGYVEGPFVVGGDKEFINPDPTEMGSVMIGQTTNSDVRVIPFYQLITKGFVKIKKWLKVEELLSVKYIKSQTVLTEFLFASKSKNFRIDHPLNPDHQYLIYSCLEGPENGVYTRGRLTGKSVIHLPSVWEALVHSDSITVQLQPVGTHQNIIVKAITNNKIYLQSDISLPIDCYYHVYGERKDIGKLRTEVNKNEFTV